MYNSFTDRGTEAMDTARTTRELDIRYNRTCEFCALTGKHLDCDRCPIAAAYESRKEDFKRAANCPVPTPPTGSSIPGNHRFKLVVVYD